ALAEREPIDLEKLDSYRLKLDLLEQRVAGLDLEATFAVLKASGRLPLGSMGEAEHRSLCENVETLYQRIEPFQPCQRLPALEVDLVLDAFRIKGLLTRLTPRALLSYRPAPLKPKDRVRAWVHHLAWNALPPDGRERISVIVGEEK